MYKGVFYFHFSFDTPELYFEKMYGFVFSTRNINTETFFENSEFLTKAEELEEKYGIHDWSSSPSDGIYGIGYTTYEVAPNKVLDLMAEWQQFFHKITGSDQLVGIVKEVKNPDTMDSDIDVYDYLMDH